MYKWFCKSDLDQLFIYILTIRKHLHVRISQFHANHYFKRNKYSNVAIKLKVVHLFN